MIVFYRITDLKSTNPPPIFEDDKFRLNKLCLRSFADSFRNIKPHVVFLADFCGKHYTDLIDKYYPYSHEIIYTEKGINETCLEQYKLAKKVDDDMILFQECDYLYTLDGAEHLYNGAQELGMCVPYDNLNFYLDPTIHSEDVILKLVKDYHWRPVERTTMTFMIQKDIFINGYDIFMKYGYLDNDVWHEMRDKGHQMWSPIPSLATHMVTNFMAPAVNWNHVIETYV